jgi:hypothetical protein
MIGDYTVRLGNASSGTSANAIIPLVYDPVPGIA